MSAVLEFDEQPEAATIFMDADRRNPLAENFETRLAARVVGQERAVHQLSRIYQTFLAGLNDPNRPIGTMLFLGPTGCGKTRVVEAAAEVLFADPNAVIKIDCAEFQHSHEIAKLIGSPPGYLGHRDTTPLLSQENLKRFYTQETQLSLVLFDEIEKASDALWNLLLGILDKGTLTLGDNRHVDFSRTIVVMTSNLGAREMSTLISGGIGFSTPRNAKAPLEADIDQKIYRTALEAARRKFSPEFMNRIDKAVVFRSLTQDHLRKILDLEIAAVQERIKRSARTQFRFECSDEALEMILAEGTDYNYGARHLKRAVERFVVFPLSNLLATEQLCAYDHVTVGVDSNSGKLTFSKQPSEMACDEEAENNEQTLVMGNVQRLIPRKQAVGIEGPAITME